MMKRKIFLLCFLAAVASLPAQTDAPSHTLQARDANAAWDELEKSNLAPASPPGWENAPPTPEEKAKFYIPYAAAAADKSRDFYTKFPADSRAGKAKLMEFRMEVLSIKLGATNQDARLAAAEKTVLADPSVTGEDRAGVLFMAAQNSGPDQARTMLQEITNTAPDGEIKQAAGELLAKMHDLGKPIEIQFTAVDGRPVDLSKLKGKVVLVDFWATWCGPCRGEIPNVKKTYDRFHSQGFDIIGISLDKDKDSLTQFIADNKMEWPQYFDGLMWENKLARRFGITSIPTMWLVDKKGNLRNIDAREDLAGSVEKLLAE